MSSPASSGSVHILVMASRAELAWTVPMPGRPGHSIDGIALAPRQRPDPGRRAPPVTRRRSPARYATGSTDPQIASPTGVRPRRAKCGCQGVASSRKLSRAADRKAALGVRHMLL